MENTQNGADSANQATVNGVKQASPKKHFKIKKPRRRALFSVAGVTLLLAGMVFAGYWFVYKPANDYAIKVGNIEVSKEEYAYYKTQYKKNTQPAISSDKKLNEYIIDSLKYVAATEKFDAAVTQAEIDEYVKSNFDAKSNKWLAFVAKAELSKILIANSDGGGNYAQYTLPFCRSFVLDRTTAEGYGDEAQIETDRKYAEDKANAYMKAIANNPTATLAKSHVAEILKDEKLDYGFAGNQSKVFKLTQKDKQFESVSSISTMSPETIEIMNKLTDDNPISSLMTETRPVSIIDKYASPDTPIAYYFLVKLSDTSVNFDYKAFAKNLEVKVNV